MKVSRGLSHLLLVPLLLGLSATSRAALPTDTEAAAVLKKHLLDTGQAKGAAVALVDANGIRIVSVGAARQGVALTADNLFEIGSVTKTFAGVLLALVDERGEAKLDDAVEKFLPDGIQLRDSQGLPLRLVDLATHRSGLPRLAHNMPVKDANNPYADYTEAHLLDFVKTFKASRARNAEYEYSNIGYGLLGYVLTRAAKAASFDTLVTERILKPLNMQNTTADPARLLDRLAQPHTSSGQATPPWDLPLAHAAAGSMRATAGDLGRYIEVIAGLKQSPLTPAMQLATTPREAGPGRANPIGLAFTQVPFDGRKLVNHDGGTMGSSSSLMADAQAKEGVFVVANTSVRLFDVALHFMDKRHSLAPREPAKTVTVAPEVLARYVGIYKLSGQMSIEVRVSKDGRVTAQASRQGEFEIFPESETRFFAKVAPIVMTFGDIADGRSGSFVLEQGGAKVLAKRQ